jgi:phage terminase small subunit
MTPLNPLQKKFCHEYLIDFCGKEAAIRAGYSPKGAAVAASRMLKVPHIAMYLQKLMKHIQPDIRVTTDRVLNELARLAFHDPGDYFKRVKGKLVLKDIDELTSDQRAAVQEYDPSKKILKLYSKDPSLDKLGKYLKLFTELHEQQQNFTIMPELKLNGVTILFNVGQPAKKT